MQLFPWTLAGRFVSVRVDIGLKHLGGRSGRDEGGVEGAREEWKG